MFSTCRIFAKISDGFRKNSFDIEKCLAPSKRALAKRAKARKNSFDIEKCLALTTADTEILAIQVKIPLILKSV